MDAEKDLSEKESGGAQASLGAVSPDNVGARIRRRRRSKRMTLRQLASATGLAEGFLSQLERGVYGGSVATLQKISTALGLTVGDLFDETWSDTAHVRLGSEVGTRFGVNARKVRLTPKAFDHVEVFVGIFGPNGSTGEDPYRHGESEELIVVLDGVIVLTLEGTEHELCALESIAYSSELSHRVREARGETARVLWVISPPSY